ncbi:MAG: PHP domain-containing protein [Candidatus Eisenbacteria bacterium]|nr:PHP domain-containing protein [Candidatus Eisenbacteria bacterium]
MPVFHRGARRRLIPRALLLLALILWGINLGVVAGDRPRRPAAGGPLGPEREWVGAVHVHTRHSDGGGTVDEVARAAAAAGLDFVLVSDHNTLDGMEEAGYRHGVLVVVATEQSLPEGHLVVAGVKEALRDPAERTAAAARAAGGFSWIAHPFGRPSWKGPVPEAVSGIEIVNADSEWRDESPLKLLSSLVALPVFPQAPWNRLVDRPDKNLALFDSLSLERPAFFVGAVDAHARIRLDKKGRFAIPFPSYETLFRGIRTHALLTAVPQGDGPGDTRLLLYAILNGRSFVGYDGFGESRGFRFAARRGDYAVGPGERLVASNHARLEVELPLPGRARIRIYKNGALWKEGEGPGMDVEAGPGIYRVEVDQLRRSARPWILTNPIRIESPVAAG